MCIRDSLRAVGLCPDRRHFPLASAGGQGQSPPVRQSFSASVHHLSLIHILTAGTKYDKAWMGFKSNRDSKKNHVSLTFDLYAPASISQIILSSKYDLANNQTIPQNLKIYTSHDKANWFLLKEFDNDLPASGNAVKMRCV